MAPPSSPAPKKANGTVEAPPLARYLAMNKYTPEFGDFIIWAGWFKTWYGIVCNIDASGQAITVIWEALPMLLLTLTDEEQRANSQSLMLGDIITAKPGKFAVMKHDAQHNTPIWYI